MSQSRFEPSIVEALRTMQKRSDNMRQTAAERFSENPELAAYWIEKADNVDAVADYVADRAIQRTKVKR